MRVVIVESMRVEEDSGPRFDAALDLFAEGEPLLFNQVSFQLEGGVLRCAALSSYQAANASPVSVQKDYARAVETLEHLRRSSARFRELTEGREIAWQVDDDYGMGSIEIARVEDGRVIWARGVERPTSLQRAIDRALPIVEDRLLRHPGPPLDTIREVLLVTRELPHSAEPPTLIGSLVRLVVDGYADLTDGELSQALDWVERAAAEQAAARTRS